MSERVRVVHDGDGRLAAVKSPPPGDPERTHREFALLRTIRHPGVVELLPGHDGPAVHEVWTHWVGSRSTADLTTPIDPDLAAGLGLAVGRTLEDLHRLGVVHGALDASHVLLDPHGRPVLCGFGGAATIGAPLPPDDLGILRDGTADPPVDVAGLGRLLATWLRADGDDDTSSDRSTPPLGRGARRRPSSRTRALLAIADQACRPDPADRPGLRALLDAIRSAAPTATLGRDASSPGAPSSGATSSDPDAGTPPDGPPDTPATGSTAWPHSPATAPPITDEGPTPRVTIDAPLAGAARPERPGELPDPDIGLLDPGDRGMWDELHGIRPLSESFVTVRSRWRAGAAASVAALVAFIAVSAALSWPSDDGATASPSGTSVSTSAEPTATVAEPATTTRAATATVAPVAPSSTDPPVVTHEGRRFEVGVAGDLAIVDDWHCDGRALVALYRPSTGAIFVFDSWPRPGERLESTAIAGAAAGTVIAAAPRPDGCLDLVVGADDEELARFGPEDLT
jgi:hypothetical protein